MCENISSSNEKNNIIASGEDKIAIAPKLLIIVQKFVLIPGGCKDLNFFCARSGSVHIQLRRKK